MSEANYWHQLVARVSRELTGLEECHRRKLWCDGFVPDDFGLDSSPPEVSGSVWIGVGPREHERWSFRLVLNAPVKDRAEIPWAELFPPNDVTGWLTVDLDRRRLAIEPGAAIPHGA